MLRTLPRLLRRTGAALVHTQYAVPVRSPCPAVVTIHDLSFEHGSAHMALKDRLVFRRVVPRAARAARRVLTVSERTRADLVRLYGLPEEKVVVTPNGVDPAFAPGNSLRLAHIRARCRGGAAAEEPPCGARCRGGGPAAARRRRPVKDEALAARAARCRRRSARLRLPGGAGRALPGRGLPGAGIALRRLWPSRCSRRWRAARPSSPSMSPRCAKSAGTLPSSSRRRILPTACGARLKSVTSWPRQGSNGCGRSAGE